jgi:uncharacterized protein YwgA
MNRQQLSLALTLKALGLPLRLDTFDDRMVIQKTIYLCQIGGVHLGYRYNWYRRGPYSPDLTRDAFDLVRQSEDESEGCALDVDSVEKLSKLAELWRNESANRPRWLELVASVAFLRGSYDGRDKDVSGLREILARNDKHFSEAEISQALEKLAHHGLASAKTR